MTTTNWVPGYEAVSTIDHWRTHRAESYEVHILDYNDIYQGQLDGVKSGSIDANAFRSVISGGSLELTSVPDSPDWTLDTVDWLSARLQVIYKMQPQGLIDAPVYSFSLGVFLPARYQDIRKDGTRNGSVTLLDKLTILDQDKVESVYSAAAGSNLIIKVEDIIASTGELRMSIQPSSATARTASVWPAGTSKLTIINALLEAAGYSALWVDHQGIFRANPYIAPADRPIMWDFAGGPDSTTADEYGEDFDAHAIPNRFLCVSGGTDDTDALVGVAENTDPESPYSYQSRRRWITSVEEGVQAADQSVVDQLARRKLLDSATPAVRMDLAHLVVGVPDGDDQYRPLRTDDAVLNPSGVRTTIAELSYTLGAGSLATTTLRRFEGVTW